MDFVAIDFETANEQQIPCSLGIVVVENNMIKETRSYLINPESYFSDTCIDIHGIHTKDVASAPTFPEVWAAVSDCLTRYPLAAHNASFDLAVLCKSLARYNIPVPEFTYYCTLQTSRNVFPCEQKHTLDRVCDRLNIELDNHHVCDADALACAKILLYFSEHYPDQIYLRHYYFYPEDAQAYMKTMKAGNANFDDTTALIQFPGKSFVVTGAFKHFSRNEIKEYITSRGGLVKSTVSKNTDYLIVGDLDVNVIKDKTHTKSSKILAAEKVEQETGKDILILTEEQFLRLQPPCADTDPALV